MASANNIISGKIQNVVFYTIGDKQFMRSKPARVKQTTGTKERSINFGLASAAGKALRAHLQKVLLLPKNRGMQIRFAGAIAKWLQRNTLSAMPSGDKLPFINDFSFSDATSMAVRCRIPMQVQQPAYNLITVRLSAFVPNRDIIAPANTVAVKLTISVAGCSLANGNSTGHDTIVLHIDHNNIEVQAQLLGFHVPAVPGSLLVTVGSMQYILSDGTVCSKPAFMPCSVIDALYVG